MKILLIKTISMLALFAIISSCESEKTEWSVTSPSENIRFSVVQDENNQLKYNVSLVESGTASQIITNSPLGIRRADETFIQNMKFVLMDPVVTLDETFSLPIGKRKIINSVVNELTLNFENQNGAQIQLIVRAGDDGVAFRYRFPNSDEKLYSVEEELTGFFIAGEGKTWMAPYDKVSTYSPGYERYFENGIPIGTAAPSEEGWCLPALFQTKNAWMLLTEAALDSNYFGSHLQPNADGGKYTLRMPEATEANNVCTNIPSSTLPWATPWRVMIIGKNLSDVVESDMVVELNPPSAIPDESWIKPGRASWSWWSDWPSSKNFESLKKFVDLSVEMGWEYSLVDANWDLMTGRNVEELIKYANSKNIGILMWYNSGGPHNNVTERPRDIMSNPELRKAEFKKLADWGVKGVKVDFFQSDKPQIIKQYFDILKDAADNKIMVNFHGCTMPRGWNRTWPNLVSMEAVRGAESYGFDTTYTEKAVWHNTILPFTRNVIGSMDYTPVTFSNQKFPHKTSFGHELALSVVYESGILHLADNCESYRSLPEEPKSFLKNIPVVWDDSKLLAGYPGEDCVIARKTGDTWYIGGINGSSEKKSWEIDLTRLRGNDFSGFVITDGETGKQFSYSELTIKAGDKIFVSVLPFGGFVSKLK
jgi:alpha-glucosidase